MNKELQEYSDRKQHKAESYDPSLWQAAIILPIALVLTIIAFLYNLIATLFKWLTGKRHE